MPELEEPSQYGEIWAPIYDHEHRFKDPAPTVELLVELADGRRVLELGIGTGRVALPLSERGLEVAGIDASPAMVDRLRAKPGGADVSVAMGDMATTPLGGPYGLVFIVFNTFFSLLTQSRQVECFRNVAASLDAGGHFVLECFVPDVSRFNDGDQAVRVVALDDASLRLNASTHDAKEQLVRTHVLIIEDGQLIQVPVSSRYAWPSELDLMAELAGLRLAARWADWTKTPFSSGTTQHVSVYEAPKQ